MRRFSNVGFKNIFFNEEKKMILTWKLYISPQDTSHERQEPVLRTLVFVQSMHCYCSTNCYVCTSSYLEVANYAAARPAATVSCIAHCHQCQALRAGISIVAYFEVL